MDPDRYASSFTDGSRFSVVLEPSRAIWRDGVDPADEPRLLGEYLRSPMFASDVTNATSWIPYYPRCTSFWYCIQLADPAPELLPDGRSVRLQMRVISRENSEINWPRPSFARWKRTWHLLVDALKRKTRKQKKKELLRWKYESATWGDLLEEVEGCIVNWGSFGYDSDSFVQVQFYDLGCVREFRELPRGDEEELKLRRALHKVIVLAQRAWRSILGNPYDPRGYRYQVRMFEEELGVIV